MPRAIVAGGGLAGLAAAAALGEAGVEVKLFEARPFLGGRATSFPLAPSDPDSELIDNCQHVLLACFTGLLDLYRRLGVTESIRFHDAFYFLEPGGRVSVLRRGLLPAPAHFLGASAGLKFIGLADKIAISRALAAIRREYGRREDLDRITMLEWLEEKRQTRRAIDRFWQPVLVSAVNEDLDRMAARHGLQVFRVGFLGRSDSYRMGLAAVPLGDLYANAARLPNVRVETRAPVERIAIEGNMAAGVLVAGELHRADWYISAVPFERVPAMIPDLNLDVTGFEHSPITGIHLWFDRPVMELPYAALLDRTIQWAFNKGEGRYVQVVVSASRSLVAMGRAEVIALAVSELGEFFPTVRTAHLEKAHVIKEARATFSARPCLDALRPAARTAIPNLFLAGDWTRTGWPATMEGAVQSGYLAAQAALAKPGFCDN
jgi:squalene-associated FAD-dependent desaturase